MKRRLLLFRSPIRSQIRKEQDKKNKGFCLALEESGLNRASKNVVSLRVLNKHVLEKSVIQLESVTRTLLVQSLLCSLFAVMLDPVVTGISLVLCIDGILRHIQTKNLRKEIAAIESAFNECQLDLDNQTKKARDVIFGS